MQSTHGHGKWMNAPPGKWFQNVASPLVAGFQMLSAATPYFLATVM